MEDVSAETPTTETKSKGAVLLKSFDLRDYAERFLLQSHEDGHVVPRNENCTDVGLFM